MPIYNNVILHDIGLQFDHDSLSRSEIDFVQSEFRSFAELLMSEVFGRYDNDACRRNLETRLREVDQRWRSAHVHRNQISVNKWTS